MSKCGILWYEKQLCCCVISDNGNKIIDIFKTGILDENNDHFDRDVSNFFEKTKQALVEGNVTTINHKTVSSSPVQRQHRYKKTSQLSDKIKEKLESFASANNIDLDQVRKNISNTDLKLFTKVIQNLKIFDEDVVEAWKKHAYFTSLHATNKKAHGLIKKLFHSKMGTSHRTKEGKQRFNEWLENL